MGLEVTDVQKRSREMLLDARNMDRLVQSENFVDAWNKASGQQKVRIEEYVWGLWPNELKELIGEICLGEHRSLTVSRLRKLASGYKIKNYSRLSKEELIKELEKHENAHAVG